MNVKSAQAPLGTMAGVRSFCVFAAVEAAFLLLEKGDGEMAKVGRPRKYETAKQLRAAVERYFASITYERDTIIHRRELSEDEKGNPIVKETPEILLDKQGKPVKETVYLEEPSVAGLRLHLGVSKSTWAGYAEDEEMAPVVALVRDRMEARLEELLTTRNSVQGVVFNLKNNYGWKDKQEVTQTNVGMSVEEYLARLEQDGKKQEF